MGKDQSLVSIEHNTSEQNSLSFHFVDWIRMIAMIAIVWAHTPSFAASTNFDALNDVLAYFFFMDFFKFGVISFFMISGFLLARKIEDGSPVQYFKRRVYSTIRPYLFAFALVVLLFVFKTQVLKIPSDQTVFTYIRSMFLESALWFLPNYWICLFILLCCRPVINKLWFGMVLLLCTLISSYYFVYSDNAQSHVYAILAFVFYLWLGYIVGKRNLHLRFEKYNLPLLLLLSLSLYIACTYESYFLFKMGYKESLSILRITNQLYSLAMFVTMVRIFRKPFNSNYFSPRKETFGIYLYHMFAIALLTFIVKLLGKFGVDTYSLDIYEFMGWFLVKFFYCYFFTLIIVKLLIKYNIGYLNYIDKPLKRNVKISTAVGS